MKIVTAFISDRGDKYLPECLHSYADNECSGLVTGYTIIDDRDHALGMAGAVRSAWSWALEQGADYLLHVEEDFRFVEPIPMAYMVHLLRLRPELAQVVLKRQPWSRQEREAGDMLRLLPHVEHGGYLEQTSIFSLNPCLIPRRVLELEWIDHPDGVERAITNACLDAGYSFAFYGKVGDKPLVEHVGHERSDGWRL